jgi:hypothetical protein
VRSVTGLGNERRTQRVAVEHNVEEEPSTGGAEQGFPVPAASKAELSIPTVSKVQ